MFNRCTHDFAELLRALKGSACALCGVLEARARELIRSAAASNRPDTRLLCARHLAFALARVEDSRTMANLLRSSVIVGSESGIASKSACPICGQLDHITSTPQRVIRRLDARPRWSLKPERSFAVNTATKSAPAMWPHILRESRPPRRSGVRSINGIGDCASNNDHIVGSRENSRCETHWRP